MSLLGRFLDWFGKQSVEMQVGTTTVLFAALFVAGLYTLGLVPLVVIVAVLIDHWVRGRDEPV
jgi:hypothetical protein